MDEYEGFLTYDLGETCIDSLEVGGVIGTLWKRSGRISVRAERGETWIRTYPLLP